MPTEITLNGHSYIAVCCDVSEDVNPPTGNVLKKIKAKIQINGEAGKGDLDKILSDKKLNVKLPEFDTEYRFEVENHSCAYLDGSSVFHYDIDLCELDKDLPEDWNPLVAMRDEAVMNRIRIRSIIQLLVDKGLITSDEFSAKVKEIYESDYQEIFNLIVYGKGQK